MWWEMPPKATGLWALEASASKLDLTPRILAAPGFTLTAPGDPASPVTTNLIAVAARLRAIVVVDGPNINETNARTGVPITCSSSIHL